MEIKTYARWNTTYFDWMINDSHLDIRTADCTDSDGNCSDEDVTYNWTTWVNSSCAEWDYKLHTYIKDQVENERGYTDLGIWLKVDNRSPVLTTVTLSTYKSAEGKNITVTSNGADTRSGIASCIALSIATFCRRGRRRSICRKTTCIGIAPRPTTTIPKFG